MDARKKIPSVCKQFVNSNSSPAPFAKPRFQRFSLLRSSFLLISRRSLRVFLQTDFHASMKSFCKNTRVSFYFIFCTFTQLNLY